MRTRLLILLVGAAAVLFADAGTPGPQLRVLTYNIHHGEGRDGVFDLDRLARIIRGAAPDVVALQEVDRETLRSGGVDQAAMLAEKTGLRSFYGRAMYYQEGEYGCAVLSRYPMRDVRFHPLPYRAGSEPRVAVEVTVVPDGGLPEFVFVSTHLCNANEAVRIDQTARLLELFGNLKLPVVLAGDFNAQADRPPMEEFFGAGWVDATRGVSRIDYVLVHDSGPWRVTDQRALDEPVASDHLPLLAILDMR